MNSHTLSIREAIINAESMMLTFIASSEMLAGFTATYNNFKTNFLKFVPINFLSSFTCFYLTDRHLYIANS